MIKRRSKQNPEPFAILVNGKVAYHSPSDYGDTEALGEAPMSLAAFWKANPKRPGLRYLADLKPGESDTRDGVTVTRVGGDCCRTVDVTYDIVTPESAEEGDVAERGWDQTILVTPDDLDEEDPSWVDATVRLMRDEHVGSLEADSSSGVPRWFMETDGEQDYGTGETRTRSFHPQGFTDKEMRELATALGIRGFRKNRGSRPPKRSSRRAR